LFQPPRPISGHRTRSAEQRPARRIARALVTGALAVNLLGSCVIRELASDQSGLVYSYSSLDFSGKVWQRAQQHCQRSGKKVIHQSTDCVVWLRCVSRFTCE
jgi:hypothetical protein